MAHKLLFGFDHGWYSPWAEWWGSYLNNSDHEVTFSYSCVVDHVPIPHKDKVKVPPLHVVTFGGWTGFIAVGWKWRATTWHHRALRMKGYDPYRPRVPWRRPVDRGDDGEYDDGGVTDGEDLTWEVYRWQP